MQVKRKNGLKVAAITIALLLCLALAVGITGAWYQAQRQATGTLSMDQGIIIDYKGFGKTGEEESGIWSRETTTTFLLFDETNAQPGEQIAVNAAGIRANENSVNFYARVKLSYKFYNGETPVELADATKLIKTSSSFWANSWVDGGGADGYYYYATGSTLNKFEKGAVATTPFVDLFSTDAKFVIEGENFVGADNGGEGGGFVVGDTSINKIEVYLTLETLQGDATAEQAKALGWKIASQVKFAEATGKMETSVNKTATTEDLNVSVNNGEEVAINDVVFNYDSDTTLKFDSNNVEYITLTYSDGSTKTFDAENYEVAENTFKVNAKSSKGTVTGYTVGLFSDSEYRNVFYKLYNDSGNKYLSAYGYMGDMESIVLSEKTKVKERTGKIVFPYSTKEQFFELLSPKLEFLGGASSGGGLYPFNISGYATTITDRDAYETWLSSINSLTNEEFIAQYGNKISISFKAYFNASGFASEYYIKGIEDCALSGNTNLRSITLTEQITKIGQYAFGACENLESFVIPDSVTEIGRSVFNGCDNLNSVIIGKGLTYLSESMLSGSFTSITIPSNIQEIRKDALDQANLTIITCETTVPPTLGNGALGNSSRITAIYVPVESVEAYKNADGWKDYADKIQAIA